MKTNIEYEFYDVLSDETNNEVRWRGKPFEAFKDIMFVDGNYEFLMSEADRIAQSGGSGRNAHHDAIDDNARSDVTERKDRQSGVEDLIDMHACKIASGMEEREYEDDVYKDICRDGGLSCHHAALWHFVEESKIDSTRSITEVKSISNERNGYPSEGSFIFLDKYGACEENRPGHGGVCDENYEKYMMKVWRSQPSDENMKVMGGGHTLDDNYVIELNQLNNENYLMTKATRNNITVNGTVPDNDGPNRGPDRRIFEMKENEAFGDAMKIVNRGSAVRGRDQRPHPG